MMPGDDSNELHLEYLICEFGMPQKALRDWLAHDARVFAKETVYGTFARYAKTLSWFQRQVHIGPTLNYRVLGEPLYELLSTID